ncbi:acyl-CoA dehydrogenase [Ketobacter sp. MCCC 1A13808]|uniref:acyl-CoA dehydrogenase family protein n=1 Tax=Ketobacter sp. MCCC 1A13808 TaxID=2602738 RepID=UPI0012EB155F|nr:acyl-CoA dehydrogenase [Ketobacter sp. MCCC 1A13808]MVF13453.1 acyl-CoA dehydrogenase [Ketobacter sp. MCCC 1A13808]
MNLNLSDDQRMMRENFARFLTEESSMSRVRAAQPGGFDQRLWQGLADMGAFSMRVPEASGGLELGLLDAAVFMEEVGRTLASGPVAETLVATRLLALLGAESQAALLDDAMSGKSVVTIAFHDIADEPMQWVPGGAVATKVIARNGSKIVLVDAATAAVSDSGDRTEENLASTPIAELHLADATQSTLSGDESGLIEFAKALEEWKLLAAAALSGLSREAVQLAAAYACEREAFGQPIGTYQAISHPLADRITDIDGGKYFVWKTIHDIADAKPGDSEAAAQVSLSAWWNAKTASLAVSHSLHVFGGYGLTTEYDIHLYNLRAKDWALILGDPERLLEEAGRRLYGGEVVQLPDVGEAHIDFDLGEQAREMGAELDAFFTKTLTPELKAKAHYSFDGFDAGVHRKLAQAKLLFPDWPVEWGGRAAPPYAMSALSHVWEKHQWSHHAVGTTSMVGTMLRRFGSDEAKRDILSKIVAGEAICSLGYSEPHSGSDVFAVKTRATRDGDGWRIDGSKMFTSGANIAQYVLMLTRTNSDVAKHKGLTMFVVPLDAPGIEVQPVYTFQEERTNITYYEGVKIPDSYRLGDVDAGLKVMAAGLELEHGGGSFAGHQRAMVDAAVELCREIRYRGRPLIEDPIAQKRLAKSMAHFYLTEMISRRSLWSSVEKLPNLGYGPMAKMFSSEKFMEDASDLLDLTAPYSLSKRHGPAGELNLCYRHAQGTTIYGGTSEIHRSMIAERALGLPRSRAK